MKADNSGAQRATETGSSDKVPRRHFIDHDDQADTEASPTVKERGINTAARATLSVYCEAKKGGAERRDFGSRGVQLLE